MSVHLSVPSTYPSLKRLPSFYFPFCFSIGCCWRQKVYRSSKLTIPWPQLSHFLFFLFLAMIGSFIILSGRLATIHILHLVYILLVYFQFCHLWQCPIFQSLCSSEANSESLTKHWWETEDFPTNSFCRSRICTADHDNMRTHTPAGYTACRLFHLMTHLRVTTSPPPCLHAGAPFSLTDNLWSERPDFSLRSTGSCSTSS